jgi:hypothetical protein
MASDDEAVYSAITPEIARVLHLLAKRYSRREIAEETGFSPSTVRNYIERMEDQAKLGQRELRDWWNACEPDYLRWLARQLEIDPGALAP